MQNDPSEIASSLIHTHGKRAAMRLAIEETLKAQGKNDNYSLSIWRDVKRILREDTKLGSQHKGGQNEKLYRHA